jgi:hypothetical protein
VGVLFADFFFHIAQRKGSSIMQRRSVLDKGITFGNALTFTTILMLAGCGGGGSSSNNTGATGANSSAALYNTTLTAVGAVGNYTLTTTRTSSGITQNGVTKLNAALPASQATFCSDATVHTALTNTIGFMGTLSVTNCTFSGTTGQIDMMIDLGIGAGSTTAGSVSFSYQQNATTGGAVITGFVPSSAFPGDYVTIFATGLTKATSSYLVKFNGTQATVVGRDGTGNLVAKIPLGATTGNLTVTDVAAVQTYTASTNLTVWNGAFQPIPVGGGFSGVLNNVATDFVDLGGATVTVTATDITVDLTLKNLPATLNFNQAFVPQNYMDYAWYVEFDTNNDGAKDYVLSASHYKLSATPVTGALLSNIQTDVWTSAGTSIAHPTASLIGTTGLRLTVPISANPVLANITSASKVRFRTFYRNSANTSVDDSM